MQDLNNVTGNFAPNTGYMALFSYTSTLGQDYYSHKTISENRYNKLNKRLNYVAGIGEDPIGTGTNVTKINWSNDEADSYPAWNNGSGAKVSLGTVITGYINSYNNIIDPVNEAQQSASQALGTSNAVSTSQYSIVEALEARLGYLYTFLNEKFGEGSFDYQTTTGDQKAFDDIPGNDA